MIFDQAFYTRRMETGLGVYASSKKDRAFRDYCSKIGTVFKKEEFNPGTAEFVYYSGDFGRFVGVGVSPLESEDKTNKVVHIWVPESRSEDPSEYYLSYEFNSNYSLSEEYTQREFSTCISEEDYHRIIEKYKLTENSLKNLLYKAFLVMSGEENRLYIVFPEEMTGQEEKRAAAREIMWLISVLIPVCGEERAYWANKLSYSVFSQSNRGVVSVPFVEERPERGLYFTLFKEEQEQRIGAVPEAFSALAEKALESLESYRMFISELSECYPGDKKTDIGVFLNEFFYLQLRNGKITEVREKELPIGYRELVKRAMGDPFYRDYLFRVLEVSKELDVWQLGEAHQYVMTEASKEYDPNDPDQTMIAAYKNMMETAYDKGFTGLYKNCLSKERITNRAFLRDVMSGIWRDKGKESCAGKDIAAVAEGEMFLEKLSVYSSLLEDDSFKQFAAELLFDKSLYFEMRPRSRREASELFNEGNGYFEDRIKKKIMNLFQNNMAAGIEFLRNELKTGSIEEQYAAAYFNSFVTICADSDKEYHVLLQDLGHEFLTKYEKNVDEQDLVSFRNLDKTWKIKDLKERLSRTPIDELANFSIAEFSPYKYEDRCVFVRMWCDEVISRLGSSDSEREALAKPEFSTFKRLVGRTKDVISYCQDRDGLFKSTLWESCGTDLERRILCSNSFGVTDYSIWTTFIPDIAIYKQIAEQGNTNSIIETEVKEDPKAEFNRRCYGFWRFPIQSVQREITAIKELEQFGAFNGLTDIWNDFCLQLMSESKKRGADSSYNESLNYMVIYATMLQKYSGAKERCEDYIGKFYSEDAPFFDRMLEQLERFGFKEFTYHKEMRVVREIMKIEDVNEQKLKKIKDLLYEAEKCFGEKTVKEEIPLMADLNNHYNSEKENLVQSIKTLENEKASQMGLLSNLEKEISDLIEKKEKLEGRVAVLETQINNKRQIQNSLTDNYGKVQDSSKTARYGKPPRQETQSNRQSMQQAQQMSKKQETKPTIKKRRFTTPPAERYG